MSARASDGRFFVGMRLYLVLKLWHVTKVVGLAENKATQLSLAWAELGNIKAKNIFIRKSQSDDVIHK